MHWSDIKASLYDAFDSIKLVVGAVALIVGIILSVIFIFLLCHPVGWLIMILMAAKVIFG